MKEELSVGFTHRVGTSSIVIESYRPLFGRKYFVSYATFTPKHGVIEDDMIVSSSPRLRTCEEAYQWAWDQILEWCLNG